MSAAVNTIRTASGRLQPVCEYCGGRGRAVEPDERGRIDLCALARGWSVAPYPPEFVHQDGSTGDLFTCPSCDARLRRGEALGTRDGRFSRRLDLGGGAND
jgi:hypothetical protein